MKKESIHFRNRVDVCAVETASLLSPLDKIEIGHDNSGSGPGWFLDKVVVTCAANGLEQVSLLLCGFCRERKCFLNVLVMICHEGVKCLRIIPKQPTTLVRIRLAAALLFALNLDLRGNDQAIREKSRNVSSLYYSTVNFLRLRLFVVFHKQSFFLCEC